MTARISGCNSGANPAHTEVLHTREPRHEGIALDSFETFCDFSITILTAVTAVTIAATANAATTPTHTPTHTPTLTPPPPPPTTTATTSPPRGTILRKSKYEYSEEAAHSSSN